jgi:hypothetical protein
MEPVNKPLLNNKQTMPVPSLSLDKEELRRLCDILQERANSAAEIEVGCFKRNEQTDEQYMASIKTLRESFKLKINIYGSEGEELFGLIEDVFNSVNYPEQIQSFYVDSQTTLRYSHNYYPQNSFVVSFDFSKPRVFDLSLMPNVSTPNGSRIEVNGTDATWVNGVFSEIKKFIENRSSTLSIVHTHSVYDLLLWILGFPISFWVCYKFSFKIESVFGINNAFATNAFYFYVFIANLFLFRVLFHYLRWVCPLVEYRTKGNKMLVHRAIFSILSIGWLGQFIYDLAKLLITT